MPISAKAHRLKLNRSGDGGRLITAFPPNQDISQNSSTNNKGVKQGRKKWCRHQESNSGPSTPASTPLSTSSQYPLRSIGWNLIEAEMADGWALRSRPFKTKTRIQARTTRGSSKEGKNGAATKSRTRDHRCQLVRRYQRHLNTR